MKCIMCDNKKELKKAKTTMKYKQCGLDNVVLHGVEYFKCEQCGEEYYGFGDQESLHSLIAKALIMKKSVLRGGELKFLRTFLGLSSAILAARVGVTKETISRYEHEKYPIPKTFDLLMKSLVANKLPDRSYDFHDAWLNKHSKDFKRIELNAEKDGWKLCASSQHLAFT